MPSAPRAPEPQAVPAIDVRDVRHRYGDRDALAGVSFRVARGELFALLGPNGGGKSTLFRILATLQRPTAGDARILGHGLASDPAAVRRHLGIVFQNPSLDAQLTVFENLLHHGHLHGLKGAALRERIDALLERFRVADRRTERVGNLSGGLARRVELAKGLLPRPEVLLLDEPSTGLDPGARRDLMAHLHALRAEDGLTVLLTTHHMDEAERCDRVAILDRGHLVALDTPDRLEAAVGGDVVQVQASDPAALQTRIAERFGVTPQLVDGTLRVEHLRGHELVRDLVEAFGDEILSITFGRPTLEDVFVHMTGRRFFTADAEAA